MNDARGVVIAHPHGNQNVREAALAFAEAGRLRQFWTGIAWDPETSLARALPRRLRRSLERRAFPTPVRPFVRLRPWRELARLVAVQGRWRAATAGWLSPDSVHVDLDRRVARAIERDAGSTIGVAYAYDHGALATFEAARARGITCIYDLPIGYWRAHERCIAGELRRWPQWAALAPSVDFRRAEFERKDRELDLAEHVVVPSRFVADTLASGRDRVPPISIVPFGAPTGEPRAPQSRPAGDRLQVLFVGAVDLRKGVHYLAQAYAGFREWADLTIIGRAPGSCDPLDRALRGARRVGSLPRVDVLAAMRASDVFVLPTLFEGFALVILEAMSQGCVVVTTASAGAESVLRDGENGVLVPERSPEAIVAAVRRLHDDRALLARMRAAAQASAAAATWPEYRRRLAELVVAVRADRA
jgi:alpha-maltose-1-phosphate synthase